MKEATKKQTLVITILTTIVMVSIFALANYLIHKDDSKIVRVGYIYEGDGSMPYTKNFMKAQSIVEQTYGKRVQSVEFFNVQVNSVASVYERVVEANCDIIFATNSGYSKEVKKWAALHPNIQFCTAGGDNANHGEFFPNFHNYMGKIYQGRYVTGVIAGLKLKQLIDMKIVKPEDAVVGYVAAFPYPEVISGYTAFFMGVRSQVPYATMLVKYTDSWSNYSKEKSAAKRLIESGCIVVSQHSDTTGPAVACEELAHTIKIRHPVYHIGYNGSMSDIAPTTSLASCRTNWAPYEVAAVGAILKNKKIESCISGTVVGNDSWAGFEKDWVEVLDVNENIIAPGTKKLIEKTISDLKKNKIDVFSGNYTGTNPNVPSDKIDLLKNPFTENATDSAPSFRFVLDNVIKVVK